MKTDKDLIKQRFESNFRNYNKLALVQMQICSELAAVVSELCEGKQVRSALEIGAGTGFLSSKLVKLFPDALWHVNDLTEFAEEFVAPYMKTAEHQYIWGDAEQLAFPTNLDLIASASTVQWFEHLDAFFTKAAKATISGGHIAISTFGAENFKEIAATMGDSLQYHSRSEIEQMLIKNGYEICHSSDYIKSMLFDSPTDVLRHIKATGVNSIRKTRLTRGALETFEQEYREHFSIADNRVTLTYHPILMVGRRK